MDRRNKTVSAPESNRTDIRKTLLFVSGMGVVALLMFLLLWGGDIFGAPEDPVTGVSSFPAVNPQVNDIVDIEDLEGAVGVGAIAPNFTLVDLEGTAHTLAELRGQPVIINFWATWCAPCRIEMPVLEKAFADYADQDLAILAVNREDEADAVEEFFYDDMGLTFTPLLDSDADVANAYGVFNMPTTYFVDSEGVVTAVHRGAVAESQIEEYLALTLP